MVGKWQLTDNSIQRESSGKKGLVIMYYNQHKALPANVLHIVQQGLG
ncbi:MAG TPA: hypothetical protein VMH01_09895 [Puia sp.]|nr:hypothetical protein [Puia sp.]